MDKLDDKEREEYENAQINDGEKKRKLTMNMSPYSALSR